MQKSIPRGGLIETRKNVYKGVNAHARKRPVERVNRNRETGRKLFNMLNKFRERHIQTLANELPARNNAQAIAAPRRVP
jgi:hypothetical protein